MSGYLVMTAIGPDRPGIVEQLSHYIVQSNGNIEDSRMAVPGASSPRSCWSVAAMMPCPEFTRTWVHYSKMPG